MQFKFAMLEILARRPDGRASVTELWREWEEAAERQDTTEQLSELESVDLLQSGLVFWQGDYLHITDAGRSVLRALEALGKPPTESSHPAQLQSVKAIDDLLGSELRMKIFDLGLRAPDEISGRELVEHEVKVEEAEPSSTTEAVLADEAEATDSDLPEPDPGDADPDHAEQIGAAPAILPIAPTFISRPASIGTPFREARRPTTKPLTALASHFGRFSRILRGHLAEASSNIESASIRTSLRGLRSIPKPLAALTSHFGRFSRILRGHLAEGSSNIKTDRGPVGISGAVVAALTLVALLIGAGLFMGISQIKSLKLEVSALERQLAPLKKQAANASQSEKRGDAEQKNQPPIPSSAETGKTPSENRPTPTGLVLSPDETRLIREYIKPAPFAGSAAPPINVGDPITMATIPLPSPVTDKIPKLLGGKFTIRTGAIVIVKRDSRQADAVLAPN